MSRTRRFCLLWGLLASTVACGGRGPLLPGDLLGAADDDDDDDDTPPISTGPAGNGAGGKQNPPSSSGAGGVGVSAGTTSAEAGQGGAADVPPSDHDYYVDCENGNDLNAGTEQAPFKTVERALGVAIGGDTVWFEDGVWGWMNEPAFLDDRTLTVADGVELRARHAGFAQLFDKMDTFNQGGLVLAGDAKLYGLHFIGFNPALRADHGLIELDSVSFESPWDNGICDYGNHALIMLSGTAQMTMRVSEEAAFSSAKCLLRLDDSAVARVEGGQITSAQWELYPAEVAIFSSFGHSELYLSDVTVRGNAMPIIGAWHDSKVRVERAGFQGGATEEDRVAPIIHVADRAVLDVESSWFDGADLQPIVDDTPSTEAVREISVTLRNTKISHSTIGVQLETFAHVHLDNVSISDCRNGIQLGGGGSLEITRSRISDNSQIGIEFNAGQETFSMRSSTVTNNAIAGIYLGRRPAVSGAFTVDLGTMESPGRNLLRNNGVDWAAGASLSIWDGIAPTIYAVGNTWEPSTQGSDSGGGYSVSDIDATVYDADHQLLGKNYVFNGETNLTLRLAERVLP